MTWWKVLRRSAIGREHDDEDVRNVGLSIDKSSQGKSSRYMAAREIVGHVEADSKEEAMNVAIEEFGYEVGDGRIEVKRIQGDPDFDSTDEASDFQNGGSYYGDDDVIVRRKRREVE